LTTAPNTEMAELHDRMLPVILRAVGLADLARRG
jgi:putative SOS response-associated peptidase YedK